MLHPSSFQNKPQILFTNLLFYPLNCLSKETTFSLTSSPRLVLPYKSETSQLLKFPNILTRRSPADSTKVRECPNSFPDTILRRYCVVQASHGNSGRPKELTIMKALDKLVAVNWWKKLEERTAWRKRVTRNLIQQTRD